MSVSSYLAGLVSLVAIVGPWLVAAPFVRRWVAPVSVGARGVLIDAIIGTSGLIVTAELVGSFGGFRRVPLALGSVIAAGVLTVIAMRRAGEPSLRVSAAEPPDRIRLLVALAATAAVSAQWLAGTISSYRTGILQIESLHYHLPHAAFFEQTGTLWRPHEVSASSDAAFHPLNVELVHAVGMVATHTDFLSLFINLALLWLALLAAWVCGEPAGAGPAAVCAVALLCSALFFGGVAGGTAMNDIGVLAFLLAAVALASTPIARYGPMEQPVVEPGAAPGVLVALALGLALGAKLTAPAIVAALVAGWLWQWRRKISVRRIAAYSVAGAATGLFWYLRDCWFFGSPLPFLHLGIGGFGLSKVPTPALDGTTFSVAHYLSNGGVIRDWFVPSLRADFGRLWPATLALPLIGVGLAVRPGRAVVDRVLAAAAAFGFVAYLLTPSGAQGAPGAPFLFGSNVRYATPSLALALVVLARDPWLARRRSVCAILFGLQLVTLAAERSWTGDLVGNGLIATAALALLAVVAYLADRAGRQAVTAVGGAGLVLAAVAGLPAERHYLANRYAELTSSRGQIFAHTDLSSKSRIGFVGFPQTYPLYGPRFANQVQYVGEPGPDHAFNDFTSCRSFVAALAAGGYDQLVTLTVPGRPNQYAPAADWARRAGWTQVFTNPAGWVLQPPASAADPAGCRSG